MTAALRACAQTGHSYEVVRFEQGEDDVVVCAVCRRCKTVGPILLPLALGTASDLAESLVGQDATRLSPPPAPALNGTEKPPLAFVELP